MQKQSAENHLKKKHLGYLGGPILFTAPHSKKLMRGGPKYKQKQRIHYRELYTSWIAIQLSLLTRLNKQTPNSLMIWGKSSKIDELDLDPNYLLEEMFPVSQFHLALHAWASKNQGIPILHVDVHGKLDRKKDVEIDVGVQSLNHHWRQDPIRQYLQPYFEEEFSQIFKDYSFRDMKCRFNTDGLLHGLWPGKMHTMTQQAVKMGIPSIQLEIPKEVRKKLFKTPELMQSFADGIQRFYVKIIVPYYKYKTKPLKIQKNLGDSFVQTIKSKKQLEESLEQAVIMETKYSLDLNSKVI